MSSAPFSLHCRVCLDEFNVSERPPVILPCGHTYLCEPCSKRLKCCMECRSPLFVALAASKSPTASSGASPSAFRHKDNKSRSSPASSPHSSESSVVKTLSGSSVPISPRFQETMRLPIPKNLVLMAIMEAAQRTANVETRQDEGYESGDDDDRVVAGMNVLNSDVGTYIVRDKNGLVVQPLSSSSQRDEDESAKDAISVGSPAVEPQFSDQGDFESFDLQNSVGEHALPSSSSSLEIPFDETGRSEVVEERNTDEAQPIFRGGDTREDLDRKPFILRYGQTVQVVSFVDGKATLARKNGYIEASEGKQLVKVGDPVDKACKIEGMLLSVVSKKQILRCKLDELDVVESKLHQDLEEALATPDLDPFAPAPGFEDQAFSSSFENPDSLGINNSSTSGTADKAPSRSNPDVVPGPTESAEFDNFVLSVTAAQEEAHLPSSIPVRQILSPEPSQPLPYFGCTGNIIPGLLSDDTTTNTSPLYDVRRPRSSSRFTGIDFRTGLSGHMALTSPSAHVERNQQRREVRMMGEHRGLANIRRIRPSGSGNSFSNST